MLKFDDPGIVSQEVTYSDQDKKVYINDVSKHFLEIMQGGDQDPLASVEMNEETSKYMTISLKHVMFKYEGDDRHEVKTVKTVPVKICEQEHFHTEYEIAFYELNKDKYLLCVDDQ